MEIRNETLKLAVLALKADVSINEKELLEAIIQKINPPNEIKVKPKVYRRGEIPSILGISLRSVDRLITDIKKNGRIISRAVLPTVQISKRAIGVPEEDLLAYIQNCKRSV